MEVRQIGNLTENAKRENPNRRRVYDTNGLSPTLTSGMGEGGGNLQPFVVTEVKQIGNMDNDRETFENPQCGRVCDSEGLSPTINTCQGGQREPKIIVQTKPLGNLNGHKLGSGYAGSVYDTNALAPTINTMGGGNGEPMIVAMRGRNPDNPSDRTAGSPTEQRLEPNSQGICNTLTSVQKDNLVMEKGSFCIGGLQEHQTARTDGISPSLTAAMGMGGGQTPLIPDCQYHIRKLTPLECWRLMSFPDEDFLSAKLGSKKAAKETIEKYPHLGKRAFTEVQRVEKMSNSQLYKQAGNSIVKNVLMAIFWQMISGKENIYKEI